MLVLTRKQSEKIKIGDDITITVLRMKGKGVRLGIQAPEDMNVLRGELVFDTEEEEKTEDLQPDESRPLRASSNWSDETCRDLTSAVSGACQAGWCI